jgi:hypothetical protein
MKIQQMAFMLIAVTIFFAMIGLIYFSLTFAGIERDAEKLQEEETLLLIRKLSSSPELSFTSEGDCQTCVDFDKALAIFQNPIYAKLWNLDYLVIERLYPITTEVNCDLNNYPENCNRIIIIDDKSGQRNAKEAFVTIARWDPNSDSFVYEFGRILASPRRSK